MQQRVVTFDFMDKDKVCSSVVVDYANENVTVTDHTDDLVNTVFGKIRPSLERLEYFYESRCFDRGRPDKLEILSVMGLQEYSPEAILRCTCGRFLDDFNWIRFTDNPDSANLTWKDVKVIGINDKWFFSWENGKLIRNL